MASPFTDTDELIENATPANIDEARLENPDDVSASGTSPTGDVRQTQFPDDYCDQNTSTLQDDVTSSSSSCDTGNEYHQKQFSDTTTEAKRKLPNRVTSWLHECCTCCYIPKRLIVTALLGIGMLLVFSMRTNIGVTVVMILDKRVYEKLGTIDAIENVPWIPWDSRMIGFLHSVFYIGFIVTHLPAAVVTNIWPSHKLFGGCILVSSLLNLLIPTCIHNNRYILTCMIRAAQGMAEGVLYPSCYSILRHWTSTRERSRQVSAVIACGYAGLILGFPMAGMLTHYLGWQYIFYFSAGICIVWYIVWMLLSYEKPSHHTTISDSEFEFLQKSQGQDVIDYENEEVPWRNIVTSLPVIAICFCHFVFYWLIVLMLTNEALYLNQFGFNIAQTGFLSSVPHIAKVVLSFASGCIADSLLNSTDMSTTTVRKLLTGLGFGIQVTAFLIMTLFDDGTKVIECLTVAVGAFGLTTSGWSVNHYDLSTRYACYIVAVTSTVGSLGGILVPLAVGELTVNQDLQCWDNVFYLTAGIIAAAAIFYVIFASGEAQCWSEPPSHICLVQKTDPLARKPYSTHTVQRYNSMDKTGFTPPAHNTTLAPVQAN